MALAYIGLGTNIGERLENLAAARKSLDGDDSIKLLKASSIKETKPVDYTDQPDFLNQVVLIDTVYEPLELLKALKGIETKMGRREGVPKGPRIIDLDILLYDDRAIDLEYLKIPHPGIMNREFIREHLVELDPWLVHPVTGLPIINIG